MLRRVPPLFLLLAACGPTPSQAGGSVTVTLPPPKEVATPGFSSNLRDPAAPASNSASG